MSNYTQDEDERIRKLLIEKVEPKFNVGDKINMINREEEDYTILTITSINMDEKCYICNQGSVIDFDEESEWYKIEQKPNTAMNIDKYIDNQTQTDNGCVYKDYNAFANNPSAICYIPEYSLSDLQECRENGEDLTDSEIIERGIGDTRETITNAVLEFLSVMDIDTNKEELESKGGC